MAPSKPAPPLAFPGLFAVEWSDLVMAGNIRFSAGVW